MHVQGKVFKQPTYKEYTRNVFKPGQEAQCRNAAQAEGLAVYQLPQDVLPELKVIAAIIYITRVYCSMIFHSVKQHKTPKKETLYTTQYATGQRLHVLLAKTVKGTLDLSLKTLSTYTAVNSQLKDEDKAKVRRDMISVLGTSTKYDAAHTNNVCSHQQPTTTDHTSQNDTCKWMSTRKS
ncbi:hypothetical protein [Bosea sp. (in: a-proteobacteria)]|uniref:hypothetical protein n=1 Tax=Bosea sp. (in: a-proteobacteria) TaxID=1871050 RepID=UPI004033F813